MGTKEYVVINVSLDTYQIQGYFNQYADQGYHYTDLILIGTSSGILIMERVVNSELKS